MMDGFEDLKGFYDRCDKVEPPATLRLPSSFSARFGSGWLRPFAPFIGGFAVAAAFLSAAATGVAPGEAGAVVFPAAAQSAGLTNTEMRPPQPSWKGSLLEAAWRA